MTTNLVRFLTDLSEDRHPHCHALVTRGGDEDACGKPPVAVIDDRGTDADCYWPACAYHANRYGRGHVVSLVELLSAWTVVATR
jgi:hypothetical protein